MSHVTSVPVALPVVAGRTPARIPNRHGVSDLPLGGWGAIVFGAPFVILGALTGLVVLQRSQLLGAGVQRSHAVLAAALLFVGVGCWVVSAGVRDVARRTGLSSRQRRYPGQPWMWDHAWEHEAGRDRAAQDLGRAMLLAVFLVLFAAPFTWVGWMADGGFWVFRIASAFLVAGALAALGWVGYVASRSMRFGRSRLRFPDFPVVRGGTVILGLDDVSPSARVLPIVATLRCVQERWETRTSGGKRRREIVCYELWSADAALPAGAAEARFTLPVDVPGTDLTSRPARFWELELRAVAPGVDFLARFLVPVYGASHAEARRAA